MEVLLYALCAWFTRRPQVPHLRPASLWLGARASISAPRSSGAVPAPDGAFAFSSVIGGDCGQHLAGLSRASHELTKCAQQPGRRRTGDDCLLSSSARVSLLSLAGRRLRVASSKLSVVVFAFRAILSNNFISRLYKHLPRFSF